MLKTWEEIFDESDDELFLAPEKPSAISSDDRLADSFLRINDFLSANGREPSHTTRDLYERKLGVRLRALRSDPAKTKMLQDLDTHSLLVPEEPPASLEDAFENDDLGLFTDDTGVLVVKNVPRIETADYMAKQKKCEDFELFRPLFDRCQKQLKNGKLHLKQFMTEQQIAKSEFFILKGVMVYVAERGEDYKNNYGKKDARLRVIYENGTESDLLSRTLARGLYRGGSRVVGAIDHYAFEPEIIGDEDQHSGYIYVLSSLSEDPIIKAMENLYKIGFSTTEVDQRIKHASTDPTYLMAPVKVEATYKCFNMNTQKFEALIHRIFDAAKLNLMITTHDGSRYAPAEWFVVPMDVVDQAVRMIAAGDIVNYKFDPIAGELVLQAR